MRFEGVKKKINNACYYAIQKSSMLFFPNIDSINIYLKVDIQANFDISNSKGMGRPLQVFRSSR